MNLFGRRYRWKFVGFSGSKARLTPTIYIDWPLKTPGAALGGGATVASNKFGTATQQIRVVSEIQGWLSIGSSTTVTVGSNGMKIAPNVNGEYFTTTPGQIAAFNSTSTSTGVRLSY